MSTPANAPLASFRSGDEADGVKADRVLIISAWLRALIGRLSAGEGEKNHLSHLASRNIMNMGKEQMTTPITTMVSDYGSRIIFNWCSLVTTVVFKCA